MAECSRHPGNPLPGCYWCRNRTEPPVSEGCGCHCHPCEHCHTHCSNAPAQEKPKRFAEEIHAIEPPEPWPEPGTP